MAAQALGSALNNRSSRKENDRNSKEERAFLERLERLQAANRRAELEAGRRWDLEDRRYKEEAIGGFRSRSRGDYFSPEYTDTNPSRIEVPVVPEDKPTSNSRRKSGLMQMGG
jgi:hypothetical protein